MRTTDNYASPAIGLGATPLCPGLLLPEDPDCGAVTDPLHRPDRLCH